MRQIGSLASEQQATLLTDYLLTKGVAVLREQEGQDWSIWVREENQVDVAKNLLQEFLVDPQNGKYQQAVSEAERIRAEETRRRTKIARNTIDIRQQWLQPISRRAPLTLVLMGLSIFVAVMTKAGQDHNLLYHALLFVDPQVLNETLDSFYQIKQGQLWRLITPIFLHGNPLHLVFNMMWIYSLATQVEMRCGTVRFGLLTLCIAVASNLTQVLVFAHPVFLGMSGVVYGVFGYIWVKRLAGVATDYELSDFSIFLLLGFLLIGLLGALDKAVGGGGVANGAHLGGLVSGMVIGYLPVFRQR